MNKRQRKKNEKNSIQKAHKMADELNLFVVCHYDLRGRLSRIDLVEKIRL